MKIFHLSDLHIGKQLHHYSLKDEQQYVLNQIVEKVKTEKPDAVLFAGDIYDSAIPSAEAVSLFDGFLTKLSRIRPAITILMIAGNHDSGKRLSFASGILSDSKIYIAGLPPKTGEEYLKKVTLEDEFGEVDFYLLPFTKPSHLRQFGEGTFATYHEAVQFLLEREQIDSSKRNVILSHQFYTANGVIPKQSDSEIHTVGGLDQIDISVLQKFDYAALGHIHRPQKMGKENIRYCGAPLKYSVSEAGDEKSITMVILGEKGSAPVISEIPLLPKYDVRKVRGTLLEVLERAKTENCEDYVSITLTDDIDPYYPKERLEEVYDRILELCIDNARTQKVMDFTETEVEIMNPKEVFVRFFEEMNKREITDAELQKMEEIIAECQES